MGHVLVAIESMASISDLDPHSVAFHSLHRSSWPILDSKRLAARRLWARSIFFEIQGRSIWFSAAKESM